MFPYGCAGESPESAIIWAISSLPSPTPYHVVLGERTMILSSWYDHSSSGCNAQFPLPLWIKLCSTVWWNPGIRAVSSFEDGDATLSVRQEHHIGATNHMLGVHNFVGLQYPKLFAQNVKAFWHHLPKNLAPPPDVDLYEWWGGLGFSSLTCSNQMFECSKNVKIENVRTKCGAIGSQVPKLCARTSQQLDPDAHFSETWSFIPRMRFSLFYIDPYRVTSPMGTFWPLLLQIVFSL